MKSIVLYGTRTGNTRSIAEAIADVLGGRGRTRLLAVEEAMPTTVEGADLVVVGGPTEGHGMTDPVRNFFDRLPEHALRGIPAAAFDTRVNWPRVLSGSAAAGIEKRLHAAGAKVVVPAQSFIVDMKPQLLAGELERARRWAASLADAVRLEAPVLAGSAS
jgi:flavodoxin